MLKSFSEARPKTVGETNQYRYQMHQSAQMKKSFIKTNNWTKNQNIFSTHDVDESPSRVLLLQIPHDFQEDVATRRIRPFSRENMQIMNKKYREIRSNRYSSSLGIFDIQNDRRLHQPRTSSSQNHYQIAKIQPQFNPMVKSFRNYQKIGINNPEQVKGGKTAPNKSSSVRKQKKVGDEKKKNFLKRDYSDEIFLPQKQSETGHMINGFKTNLRKKCVEDNLHVMASVLRKKVKVMDKKQIMEYVNKIMTRSPFE